MSQENLSPGNCVAATVRFPKEIMSLTINVATVKILSPGNTVAPVLCHSHMFFEVIWIRPYCYHFAVTESILLFITRTKETIFGGEQRVLS